MIQIERIRMHLPAGFEHRATAIARLIGGALGKQSISQDAVLESVAITPQRISADTTDEEIALAIVRRIVSRLEGAG